jgi:ankyrin repeat protein
MKQDFLARMRTALDEIEQNAPTDLALFEYVDLLTEKIPRPTRTLFAAAAEGDLLTTRALIQRHNVDVNAENDDGVTPMYIVAAHGHTALVEVLADEGNADVNLGTPEDSTLQLVEAWKDDPPEEFVRGLKHGVVFPLYIAARNGKVDTLRALLKRGAEVDQLTNRFQTAVMGASRDGRSEVTKLLLDHGADANKVDIDGMTPFRAAAEGGQSEIITMLLDHGGLDIDQVTGEDHGIQYPGATALILAADGGHVEAVKLLLGRGADVNKADNAGETPLNAAARGGHVAAIKLLLGRGADTSKADDDGWTPVYTASRSGEAEAAHVLLKAGADARVATSAGDTALHNAALYGCLDVVRVLAERWPTNPLAWRMFLMGGGAASELQDYLVPPANRTTRNHLPRLYSKPDMMKEVYTYLYKPRYADLDQTDADGMTALQIAELNGQEAGGGGDAAAGAGSGMRLQHVC